MYEERKYSINWLKLLLTVIIGFLVIILSVKLITMLFNNKEKSSSEKVMETNLKLLDDVSKAYFNKDTLPKELGESVKVSLNELKEAGKIDDIKDHNGDKCDFDESYIEATRLESEYQLKSYLACGDEADYKNTFIDIETKQTIKPEKTTKKTTKKEKKTTTTKKAETTTTTVKPTTVKTTKKTTVKTTVATTQAPVEKTYQVSFNVNGGSYIAPVTAKEGTTVGTPTPVREGYTFAGWYYHGAEWNPGTVINQDYVLTAKWTME